MSDVIAPAAIPPTPFDAPTNPYVTVDKFRADFPVFADPAIYPDANVQIFLDMAGIMVSPAVWSRMTVTGQELLTAHFLSLQRYSTVRLASSAGGPGIPGVPGLVPGMISSKSVSKVSVSYDYSQSKIEGWGPFNLTIYGQQYAFYARLAGTGGFEVLGVGLNNVLYGQAWAWGNNVMAAWGGVVTR